MTTLNKFFTTFSLFEVGGNGVNIEKESELARLLRVCLLNFIKFFIHFFK